MCVGIVSGLYCKHTMIINYASSVVNKLKAMLADDARVVIYDHHVFIVQATGVYNLSTPFGHFLSDALAK
jgi:hypothetical protein